MTKSLDTAFVTLADRTHEEFRNTTTPHLFHSLNIEANIKYFIYTMKPIKFNEILSKIQR